MSLFTDPLYRISVQNESIDQPEGNPSAQQMQYFDAYGNPTSGAADNNGNSTNVTGPW